jgi:hypothetical protein
VATSGLLASEEAENPEGSSYNYAQTQRTNNVAIAVATQDPEVKEAFSRASMTQDRRDTARAEYLFETKTREISSEISEMRDSRMGWGQIAHHYGLHPSVLGLGYTKTKARYELENANQKHMQSHISRAGAKGSKGEKVKGRAFGRNNKGNGGNHGGGRGHGGGHGKGKK